MKWKFFCLLQLVAVCVHAQGSIEDSAPNRIHELGTTYPGVAEGCAREQDKPEACAG